MRLVLFFFFKQKTAYEMRISDWSSDVCSSDLVASFAVLCNGSVGSAQSIGGAIDPGVIDQLQRQLGSGSTSSTALDSARQSGDAQNAGAQEQGELFQRREKTAEETGRAHVRTPVTNARLVSLLSHENKKITTRAT